MRDSPLRVMTFNVRQPDLDDGPDAWEHRRHLLVETILELDADVIGTQELFVLQAEYIVAGAPQYAWFGSGRFGDGRDKHVGIFYFPAPAVPAGGRARIMPRQILTNATVVLPHRTIRGSVVIENDRIADISPTERYTEASTSPGSSSFPV